MFLGASVILYRGKILKEVQGCSVRNKKVQTKQRKPNQRGLSIIEVVITLFIIGVTLLLYQTTSRTVVLNRFNRYKEIGLRIADAKVQGIRTVPFASIPSSGAFNDPLMSSIPGGSGTITVTDENQRLKRVEVTVSWQNPQQGSATQQVQLTTFVAQGGLGQ